MSYEAMSRAERREWDKANRKEKKCPRCGWGFKSSHNCDQVIDAERAKAPNQGKGE